MKAVLDLLISISLVQSKAYPPLAAMDLNLHAFIFEPQQSLGQLALVDSKAAEMLHTYMTGYASLRRFYDLRDEKVQPEDGQKSGLRPLARKRATAMALLAVINSAADNIHGGLYDEDRGAVVQVDGLLALLGEAMVFVNRTSSSLFWREIEFTDGAHRARVPPPPSPVLYSLKSDRRLANRHPPSLRSM